MSSRRWAISALCAIAFGSATAAARAEFIDPTGDTFNAGTGFQPDITSYSGTFAGTKTTFTVNFANAIAAPSTGSSNSLFGFIDLDLDKNANTPSGGTNTWGADLTGGNSWINFFVDGNHAPTPTIGLGDEDFIDLSSEASHPGQVDVVNAVTHGFVTRVSITYSAQSLSLSIPLLGTGDGSMNFGIIVGNAGAMTDRAANGGIADTTVAGAAVPEPSTMVLSLLGAAGLLFAHVRRSKRA